DFFDGAEYWQAPNAVSIEAGTGRLRVELSPKAQVFYDVLTRECGMPLADEYDLLATMRTLAKDREKTDRLRAAMEQVDTLGYGVVLPTMGEIELKEPEILRQGGQYGVKLRATTPSLHVMKVDVETEVSPIVGSEQQSKELVDSMLQDFENDKQAIWDTNIFGRTLSSLVADGINNKLQQIPVDAEQKMRKTMGRIVNEGRGGVICILL
ncbi:MAG: stage IV sporulation protein A, partial [Clostridia bacterium]|nr:stage IV sporulation protein A [Clostridia bacterium]